MSEDYDVFIKCDCYDKDHSVVLTKSSWDDERVSNKHYDFSISVTRTPFFGRFDRVKHAFKILFNVGNRGHDYSEIVLNEKSVGQIKAFIEDYENCKGKK